MSGIQRVRCPQCGTVLRRGRPPGLCAPCELVGSDPRRRLPTDFYDRDPIVAMLGAYDFGPFFLLLRRLNTWSQVTLGGVIGLEQSRISAIERGESRLRDIELVAGMAHGLGIPPTRLNSPDISATVKTVSALVREVVSWVDRRDFGEHVATLVLGVASGLDIGAHALAGDLDTAITLGHQAIDAVSAVSSPRARDRLRTLNTVLAPLHTSPGVAELRDRLTTTAA